MYSISIKIFPFFVTRYCMKIFGAKKFEVFPNSLNQNKTIEN